MAVMQIGEVAARVGLSLRTIRHYDEIGLAMASERSVGGFRLYSEADVQRLSLIRTLRPLDFSIEQIRDLLATIDALAADDGTDSEQLRGRLATYRAAAGSRIEALRAQVLGLEELSQDLRKLAQSAERRTSGRR